MYAYSRSHLIHKVSCLFSIATLLLNFPIIAVRAEGEAPGKLRLSASGKFGVPIDLRDNTTKPFWSIAFGNLGDDSGYSTATDAFGNIFVTGTFSGPVDFGQGMVTCGGDADVFLVKYDPNGELLWARCFGDAKFGYRTSIATDAFGNVIFTGGFASTANFGGGGLTSYGLIDGFLVKYDTNGNHKWSKHFGGREDDIGRSLATDASGNIFLTGYFENTASFGSRSWTSWGFEDIFLAKYDANGNYLWSKRFGGTNPDIGLSVATDASGDVLLIGNFTGIVDFGGGALENAGAFDIFLAKYGPDGRHIWSKSFGGEQTDNGYGVATDSSGNVYITGNFSIRSDFGGGWLDSTGIDDIFLAKYGADGRYLWSKRFGSTSWDSGYGIATDASGNVYLTGDFNGIGYFGGGLLFSSGLSDIFLAKFDSGGKHVWSKRFGSTNEDTGYGVAVDSSSTVFITGSFRDTVNFGDGSRTSAGKNDIFIAKFGSFKILLPLTIQTD